MDPSTNSKLEDVFRKWEKSTNISQTKEESIKGKERWTSKFGNNPAPIRRLAHKNYRTPNQRQKMRHDGYRGFVPNIGIKLSHESIQLTDGHKCCDRCTPQSHVAWQPRSNELLNYAENKTQRRFGFFQYYFNDIVKCFNLNVSHLADTKSAVLESDEVQKKIDAYENRNEASKKANSLFGVMCAHSSKYVARITGWILMKVFQMSTTGVFAEQKEIDVLKQAVEKKVPIIYLPLHRSHLDYVILMWVLCLSDLPPPFVAAGDNLNIPLIGKILRKLGAFYIRRKPGKDHELYKAVLGQYLIELLKGGSSVEFFLEGRRSRSGLINSAKAGLMQQIVSAVIDGEINDVFLCPLSITYDKVPEESLTLELQGAKKEAENIFSALWHCITFPFRQDYGSIKVNFSTPFSLAEFIEKTSSDVRLPSDKWINSAGMDTAAIFRLATRLGEHVLHNAMETSSITAISLLSLLMLNTTTRTSQDKLEKTGVLWKQVLNVLKKQPPFIFSKGYLTDSLQVLEHCLQIQKEVDEDGENVTLVTRFRDSRRDLLLHYYSAPIVIFSLTLSALCLSIPCIIEASSTNDSYTVSKQKLMSRAHYITWLLDKTMKCCPPCVALDQQLSFDMDKLFSLDILMHVEGSLSTTDRVRMSRAAAAWEAEDGNNIPEPYEDKLFVNTEKLYACFGIGSVILPYVKALWFILDNIAKNMESSLQMTKFEFVDELCELGEEEYLEGLRPALCSSRYHVTTFVDKLIDIGVLKMDGEYVKVAENYENGSDALLQMVSFISTYFVDR